MKKKVLVLGSSGAMGQYIVPYLADMGYSVTAVSLDDEKPYTDKNQPTFFDKIINSCVEKLLVRSGLFDLLKMIINCFVSFIPVK